MSSWWVHFWRGRAGPGQQETPLGLHGHHLLFRTASQSLEHPVGEARVLQRLLDVRGLQSALPCPAPAEGRVRAILPITARLSPIA